jgi:predicted Zn finger-like uncharacterized protein
MLLACPNCGVRFRISAAALGPEGRRVRCSQCHHQWQATTRELIPDTITPPVSRPKPAPVQARPAPRPAPPRAAPPPPPTPPAPAPMPPPAAPPDLAMMTPSDLAMAPPPGTMSDAQLAAALEPVMSADPLSEPLPPLEGTPAPTEVPTDDVPAAETVEEKPRTPRGPKPEPKKRSALGRIAAAIGWLLFVLVLGGMAAVVYEADMVMEEYPETRPIFATLGFDVPAPGDGLRLTNVTSSRVTIEGAAALVVEGKVTNTTNMRRTVPPMRGSLRDANDRELSSWTFTAQFPKLEGGESASFRTEIKQPPTQAIGLSIAFVEPK